MMLRQAGSPDLQPDRFSSLLPPLHPERYAQLKKSILENGVYRPIVVDQRGTVLDGVHRLRAVAELRAEGDQVADPPRVVKARLTELKRRSLVRQLNYTNTMRLLNQYDRRRLIEDELIDNPERSDLDIARGLGVTAPMVGGIREHLVLGGKIHSSTPVSADPPTKGRGGRAC